MEIEDYTLELGSDTVPWRLVKPSADKKYCVLWLQGWTSSMDSHLEGVKRMAEKTGVTFATIDYAGHGLHALHIESSTRQQQLAEVVAVFDELKKLNYEKIIVVGGSFGAYISALLSAERPLKAVVLRAPASYPDSEFSTVFAQTEAYTDPKSHHHDRAKPAYLKNKAVAAIEQFGGTTYVLEHELDSVIDRKIPQTYFKAAKHGNYIVIPKTDHSPKLMAKPERHYAYIEHIIGSIIQAVKLADKLV